LLDLCSYNNLRLPKLIKKKVEPYDQVLSRIYVNGQAYVRSSQFDQLQEELIMANEKCQILETKVTKLEKLLELRSLQLKDLSKLNHDHKYNHHKSYNYNHYNESNHVKSEHLVKVIKRKSSTPNSIHGSKENLVFDDSLSD